MARAPQPRAPLRAPYSWRPTEWRRGQPEVFENAGLDFDLVAPGGASNVWIVECGSADEWPRGFGQFRAAILASAVEVTPTATAFDVVYESPSLGRMVLGWEGPLEVAGESIALSGYPRFDNPYLQVPFGERVYAIDDGRFRLVLDFERGERQASRARRPRRGRP